MKKNLLLFVFVFMCFSYAQNAKEFTDLTGDYLGQTPASDSAVVFARNVISKGNLHGRLAISPDRNEIFWTALKDDSAKILYLEKQNNKWTKPRELLMFAGMASNPMYSPDGNKLFFSYRENSRWKTMYIERTDTGWGEPKSDGFLLNPTSSFTNSGMVYFTGYMEGKPWNRGIFKAKFTAAAYEEICALDSTINSVYIDYTPFISSDEKYLLFSSSRPSHEENMYIFISYKNSDGSWSFPQKINNMIQFSGNARFPSISPDGKYLFFCGDDGNIYWVDINTIKNVKSTSEEKINLQN